MASAGIEDAASEADSASEALFDETGGDLSEIQVATLIVEAARAGERLDKWLAGQLPERSRSEIQRWIEAGLVTRAGRLLKASYRVASDDEIVVEVPGPEDYEVEPEPLPLDVLYEDDDLLVINKAAGMVVHPAAGNWHGTLVNAVLFHRPGLEGVGGVSGRPGIVHRLDRDTSGLILVAKNDRALRELQAQFRARTVHKSYLALVYGQLTPPQGEINAPIGRDVRDRKRMAVVSLSRTEGVQGGGRPAVTRYETLNVFKSSATAERLVLVACHPLTGRTHQIRVHLAHVKHPIVGDEVYGSRRKSLFPCPRQFLHAQRIVFRLPRTGHEVAFTAPLPDDLQAVLERLGQGA